ncbi:hypothetical protein PR202_gb00494 [Eleusine coracana subsp. coracana]|uniref:Uncharacterized protein n=1 Tax=Eleusine coracana subsp. coracana TaxID=191504 RepID=A0AAV5DUG1_ELECO|nr:hypothetical protein PR202_gb00494 [Eleusine coracana subsp. coracana]
MSYKIGTRDLDKPTIQVSAMDEQFDVIKIVSMVIAQLKEKSEQHLSHAVEYAVLTVPQHFHDPKQLRASDLAATSPGLGTTPEASSPVIETVAGAGHGEERRVR